MDYLRGNDMRKFVIILLAMFLLCGCSDYKGDVVTKHADKILEMFENKETFVVYAGQGGCNSCKEFSEVIYEFTKNYDMTFYYFSTDEKEYEDAKNTLAYDYLTRLLWTPSIYIVVDGKNVDMKEKTIQYDELVDWLDSYGFIRK